MSKNWNDKSSDAWNAAWDTKNIGSSIGSLGTGMLGIFNAGKSNAEVESIEDEKALARSVGETQFSSGSYDNLLEQFDIRNTARTNYTGRELRGLNGWQMAGNTFNGVLSGASAGASVGGPWGAVAGGIAGLGAGLGGIFTGNAKARNNAEELNYLGRRNNTQLYANYENAVSNTHDMKFNKSILNMSNSAYGGPLFNHSENFDNGITFINVGGTHEENPLGGVPVGVDQNGTPNLVEEGEVIWNDYVFSNRLKPTKKQLEEAGYKNKYEGLPFSKVAEKIQQGAAERVNDQIAIDSMNDALSQLAQMQEMIRTKKENKMNVFDSGGPTNMSKREIRKSARQLHRLLQGTPVEIGANIYREKSVVTPLYKEYLDSILNNTQIDDIQIEDPQIIDFEDSFVPLPNYEQREEARALAEEEAYYNLQHAIATSNLRREMDYNNVNELTTEDITKPLISNTDSFELNTPELNTPKPKNTRSNTSLLRYASPLINFGTFLSNLKQPDYSSADRIDKAAQQIPGGSFTPLGDYINLEPLDRNYYLNPLLATSRSNARNIQNQGLNAGQTIAGLLTNNYNTQRNIGTTLMQMDQENMNRRLQEATFNRGTNQANSQMGLQALAMDQQRANNILNATAQSSAMRNSLDAMRSQALSSSLTGIADDLGSIGREAMDRQTIKGLIDSGVLKEYLGANGGLLTRRKRRIK